MAGSADAPGLKRWLAPLLGFLGGVVGSLGAVYTGFLDVEVRDRTVDVQEMRIAFDILQLPREQVGDTYRTWACNVLRRHSEAPLDCTADDAVAADLSEPAPESQLRIGGMDVGNPAYTDIGLFVCSYSEVGEARRAFASLRQRNFGDISLNVWTLYDELALEDLSGGATIVFDGDHPERNELTTLREALAEAGFDTVREVENRSARSPWHLSVILCETGG